MFNLSNCNSIVGILNGQYHNQTLKWPEIVCKDTIASNTVAWSNGSVIWVVWVFNTTGSARTRKQLPPTVKHMFFKLDLRRNAASVRSLLHARPVSCCLVYRIHSCLLSSEQSSQSCFQKTQKAGLRYKTTITGTVKIVPEVHLDVKSFLPQMSP